MFKNIFAQFYASFTTLSGLRFATPRDASENEFINQEAENKMVTTDQKGTWIGPEYVNGVGWREKERQEELKTI